MKMNLICLAFLMSSVGLFAQTDFSGTWSGEAVKNGQPMGFKMEVQKDGRFLMAYDLNPNDLSVKGTLKPTPRGVVFQVETTIIKFEKVSSRKYAKGFTFTFKKNGKSAIYAQDRLGGLTATQQLKKIRSMFGWDEGVAAVVINHEEQYSRKAK